MAYSAADNRYESMEYRRSGQSGLKLPAVSLGLWHNFSDVDDYEESRDMIRHAFNLGITHFDLANNYGPSAGSAEVTFGKVLKEGMSRYRDEMIVSTKAGYYMWPGPYGEWGSRKYLLSSLDQSLRRMDIDYVDIFYSHRFDPDTPLEETMGALDTAVRQGKALYAGISSYSPEDTEKSARILNELGTPCLIHQPAYNMFARWIEDGLTDVLKKNGIGCIAFSPLAQGLLTDRYLDGIPEDSRAAKSWGFLKKEAITDDYLKQIHALNEIALKRGQTMAQLAVKWILRLPEVTSVLVGASSIRQIEDNVDAIKGPELTKEEIAEIDKILG